MAATVVDNTTGALNPRQLTMLDSHLHPAREIEPEMRPSSDSTNEGTDSAESIGDPSVGSRRRTEP